MSEMRYLRPEALAFHTRIATHNGVAYEYVVPDVFTELPRNVIASLRHGGWFGRYCQHSMMHVLMHNTLPNIKLRGGTRITVYDDGTVSVG